MTTLPKKYKISSRAAKAHVCILARTLTDIKQLLLTKWTADCGPKGTNTKWTDGRNIALSSRAAKAHTRLHTHTFLQEHFVGPELFSNVISR